MPNYEVEHICPLTASQQDELAEAITKIHSEKFNTPKLFVNIRFTNIAEHVVYLAGKRVRSHSTNSLMNLYIQHKQRSTNRIAASVRHGPSRTQEDYEDVSTRIIKAWDSIVPLPQVKRSVPPPDTELRMVVFFGSIVAAYEAGVMLPPAGGDGKWLKENMEKFQEKADEGDEDFVDMIKECKGRGLA